MAGGVARTSHTYINIVLIYFIFSSFRNVEFFRKAGLVLGGGGGGGGGGMRVLHLVDNCIKKIIWEGILLDKRLEI